MDTRNSYRHLRSPHDRYELRFTGTSQHQDAARAASPVPAPVPSTGNCGRMEAGVGGEPGKMEDD